MADHYVPDELRVHPHGATSVHAEKKDKAVKRERAMGEAGTSAHSESSEQEAESSVKAVKRERS